MKTKRNKFTPAYFIKKFSKIPHTEWTTGDFVSEDTDADLTCKCALGHCGATDDNTDGIEDLSHVPEAQALSTLFLKYLDVKVWDVNDMESDAVCAHHNIKGKQPRTRVLNGLRAIQKAQARS